MVQLTVKLCRPDAGFFVKLRVWELTRYKGYAYAVTITFILMNAHTHKKYGLSIFSPISSYNFITVSKINKKLLKMEKITQSNRIGNLMDREKAGFIKKNNKEQQHITQCVIRDTRIKCGPEYCSLGRLLIYPKVGQHK